ncbi:MAG: hypothetical protein J0I19_15150 [Alphaproteobacteria bacterium]|nr:hypothetical protein [Alphaproteobacteria bacterium]
MAAKFVGRRKRPDDAHNKYKGLAGHGPSLAAKDVSKGRIFQKSRLKRSDRRPFQIDFQAPKGPVSGRHSNYRLKFFLAQERDKA